MKLILSSILFAAFTLGSSFAKDVDIPVTELPKPVTEAISRQFPSATLVSAEKDLLANGDIQHFEVKIRDGEAMKELTVKPDGTISKTEKDDN